MDNVARMEVPNRMRSNTVRMDIDDRRVIAIVDYTMNVDGITPMAIWVKIRPNESTLDRELRASGKAVSLLLQYGCSLKEIAETFAYDTWEQESGLESLIGQIGQGIRLITG